MSHTAQWLIDKRLIYIQHEGDLDHAEITKFNETLSAYLEEGIAPIHIISDSSQTERMNMNVKTIQNTFTVLRDKRWGFMCVVGASTLIKFFANIVSNSFRLKVKMTDNLDEAQAFLAKNDLTLPQNTD